MNYKKIEQALPKYKSGEIGIKEMMYIISAKEIKWIKIGKLEWSEDLGDEMDWYDAMKKCEELGGRLPTRVELVDLYDNHKEECKNFGTSCYWSSSEYSATFAWYVYFSTGFTFTNDKSYSYSVRAVREVR